MKKLLEELHSLWWNDDKRYRGENPACDRLYDEIQAKLEKMSEDEIVKQLESMTDLQLEEILPVLDNLWEDGYDMKKYIDIVMSA